MLSRILYVPEKHACLEEGEVFPPSDIPSLLWRDPSPWDFLRVVIGKSHWNIEIESSYG